MITLKEITPVNWHECIHLAVKEDQKKFVASNVYSLAQAKVYPSYTPLAIYHDDEMVGFILYGIDPDDNQMEIARLMIDQRYQGKGYGRAAMTQLLEIIRQDAPPSVVYISFVPENKNAEALYLSLGFEHTGEIKDGELVMKHML
ncbi:MAG: GNAT family N-acetyltransferase [Clostridia bacterium]|nr:GNAT family N-acetyltransferase [Clostridia bacterium]